MRDERRDESRRGRPGVRSTEMSIKGPFFLLTPGWNVLHNEAYWARGTGRSTRILPRGSDFQSKPVGHRAAGQRLGEAQWLVANAVLQTRCGATGSHGESF
jgi:hypothetical protein